jgi:hypothetical protein
MGCERPDSSKAYALLAVVRARRTVQLPTGAEVVRRYGPKTRIAKAKRPPLGKERRP